MSTQKVVHSSRIEIEKINFSANGEKTWGFSPKMSGEIFSYSQTNISSFTVNGEITSLPFNVVSGSIYSVSITKVTEGIPAELILNLRKKTNELIAYNVPDFGAYKKRFIYCLSDSRLNVYVIDTGLLKSPNYLGSGVFTSSPIVQTIILPVLPDSVKWSRLEFVIDDGPKMLLISDGPAANVSGVFYLAYINPDYSIVNLDGTVFDMSSKIPIGSANTSRAISQPQYDYINNMIYVAEYYLISLNLNTKVAGVNMINRDLRIFFTTNHRFNFNPFTQEFVSDVDYRVSDGVFHNWRTVFQSVKRVVYSRVENAYYENVNNTPNTIMKKTARGNLLASNTGAFNESTTYITTMSDELGTSIRATSLKKDVVIYRLSDIFRTGNLALSFTTSVDFLSWSYVEVSAYSGLYLLLEKTGSASDKRIINTDINGEVSYFDMPESIRSLNGNGLAI